MDSLSRLQVKNISQLFRNFLEGQKVYLRALFFFLLLLSQPFTTSQCQADVEVEEGEIRSAIWITNSIKWEDVETFRRLISSKKYFTIVLASQGGDVLAALDIGDIIYNTDFGGRKRYNGTEVDQKNPPMVLVNGKLGCISACVLIYASSIKRFFPAPNLVIHNPYFSDTSLSYDEVKRGISDVERRAKYQFRRVGVSEDLWTLMTHVPSEKQRRLSETEIEKLGLSQDDPSFTDHINGIMAFRYGLSKQEYLKRKSIQSACWEAYYTKHGASLPFEELDRCRKKSGLGKLAYPE